MNLNIIPLAILPLFILPHSGQCSAMKPKPGQVSTTCYFNNGPKTGETEVLKDQKPDAIGKACGDGAGNTGIAVFDKQDEEAEEAEEAAQEAKRIAKGLKPGDNKALSAVCLYRLGPKSGQRENLSEKTVALPIDSPCSDGVRSSGRIIADPAAGQ